MSKSTNQAKGDEVKRGEWLKRNYIPILTLILVIAITVSLYLIFGPRLERLAELQERFTELKNYVYGVAVLISLVGNATVILPGAVLPILSAIGVVLHSVTGPVGPIIVGLVGGIGAAIGEITGYMVGYSGRGVVDRIKLYNRLVAWVKRWGAMAIFVFSLVPFFFDLAGIAAGALRFPFWKFLLVCWLGRTILYVGIVLAAAWGWGAVLPYLG